MWWGIGPNPLGSESYDQALTNFEDQQGRASDVLHFYHSGTQLFPSASDIAMSTGDGKNQLLMENWKPELGNTWAQVAAGVPAVDSEIDNEAAYLKATYTKKFFLSVHHEPENEIIATAGSGYTAADYAAMYRHVVLRLKADGVTNAVFVMDYMGYSKWCEQSWFSHPLPGRRRRRLDRLRPVLDRQRHLRHHGQRHGRHPLAGLLHLGHDRSPRQAADARRVGRHRDHATPTPRPTSSTPCRAWRRASRLSRPLVYWNASGYPTRIDSSPQ